MIKEKESWQKMNKKVAIITGASSGFGLLTTLELAKKDYLIIATMRNLEKQANLISQATQLNLQQNITVQQLDVTDQNSIHNFQLYIKEINRVDLLINNAGYANGGFVEEIPVEEYRKQFETNLFGSISITQLVLPYMREQKSGKIINISSISGQVGFPGLSPYVSSKYALEGWSESLRLEVKSFGIDVALIEPGSYNTNIWEVGKQLAENQSETTSPYKEYMGKIQKHINSGSDTFGNPIDVAKKIVDIAEAKRTTLRYPIGKGVKFMILVKKILPWRLWEYLVLRNFKKM
ncbi:oxidoreductase, short-chain dehydrogenase/reductase family [Bacillus cereus W]|uniref:Short-chain dehydrogenase/reductase n=2 Tax=Bacillaceae TaxID=186817 RepID=A0A242VXJ1_BACTU|nr:oxidoreductase, short-chain dehydrogenase/reductase family [Bacillus cereus W]EEM59550.1 Short-chain dehydrogenase/reductase SDR [Bacillus thuringiensis serovar monterrey BGSC 4AJ1]OTW43853.1 short-chain dehydrogenase/reductase [Bacillus thuringiensis serovar mexicanensis]OTX02850.1 short-chain dehydrogenase/reductase [Bacillus thuringiensis serovar monterrey]PGB50666.1 short-chain dehydrogenase [Bacillus anthracis]TBX94586.1 SDR family oxidoreductase [Bacillus cereus]TEA53080.1 SDR family